MGILQKLGHKLLNFPGCFNVCLVELCEVKEDDAGTRKFSLRLIRHERRWHRGLFSSVAGRYQVQERCLCSNNFLLCLDAIQVTHYKAFCLVSEAF